MGRKHFKLISLIATFSVLAFVFSWCLRQPGHNAELKAGTTHKQQVFCIGVSSSSFIAEFKTRFSGLAPSKPSELLASNFFSQQIVSPYAASSTMGAINASPPLWLLNRALLI